MLLYAGLYTQHMKGHDGSRFTDGDRTEGGGGSYHCLQMAGTACAGVPSTVSGVGYREGLGVEVSQEMAGENREAEVNREELLKRLREMNRKDTRWMLRRRLLEAKQAQIRSAA